MCRRQALAGLLLNNVMDDIEIGSSRYPDAEPSQLNVEINHDMLARIARQCPEARSGPEAVRILVAEALRDREQRVTPAEIERAHRDAIEDISCDIAEMRALLQSLVAEG